MTWACALYWWLTLLSCVCVSWAGDRSGGVQILMSTGGEFADFVKMLHAPTIEEGFHRYKMEYCEYYTRCQEVALIQRLYSILGVNVAPFAIAHGESSAFKLKTQLDRPIHVQVTKSVSEDHSTGATSDLTAKRAHLKSTFLIDALLGSVAGGKENFTVLHTGLFHHTDSLYRANPWLTNDGTVMIISESNKFDPFLLPELKLAARNNPDSYGDMTLTDIVAQAQFVLSKSNKIVQTFREVSRALNFSVEVNNSMAEILARRLEVAQMLTTPGVSYPADISRPVSPLTAAGAFLTCNISGETHVLLGQRKNKDGNGTWVTMGGQSNLGRDGSLIQTASREIFEESTGQLELLRTLAAAPFHDLVHVDRMYRLYFVPLDTCIDVHSMRSKHRPSYLRHSHHTGRYEYYHFRWFPVSALRNVSGDGTHLSGPERFHTPFAELLQVPHVQSLLQRLEREQDLGVDNLYTQSMPVRGAVRSTYGTFQALQFLD